MHCRLPARPPACIGKGPCMKSDQRQALHEVLCTTLVAADLCGIDPQHSSRAHQFSLCKHQSKQGVHEGFCSSILQASIQALFAPSLTCSQDPHSRIKQTLMMLTKRDNVFPVCVCVSLKREKNIQNTRLRQQTPNVLEESQSSGRQ